MCKSLSLYLHVLCKRTCTVLSLHVCAHRHADPQKFLAVCNVQLLTTSLGCWLQKHHQFQHTQVLLAWLLYAYVRKFFSSLSLTFNQIMRHVTSESARAPRCSFCLKRGLWPHMQDPLTQQVMRIAEVVVVWNLMSCQPGLPQDRQTQVISKYTFLNSSHIHINPLSSQSTKLITLQT